MVSTGPVSRGWLDARSVIPAKSLPRTGSGTVNQQTPLWIPAFAGMTRVEEDRADQAGVGLPANQYTGPHSALLQFSDAAQGDLTGGFHGLVHCHLYVVDPFDAVKAVLPGDHQAAGPAVAGRQGLAVQPQGQ